MACGIFDVLGRKDNALMLVKPEGVKYSHIILKYLDGHSYKPMRAPVDLQLTMDQVRQIYNRLTVEDPTWNPEPYWTHMTSKKSELLFLHYDVEQNDIPDAQVLLKKLCGHSYPPTADLNSLRHALNKPLQDEFVSLEVIDPNVDNGSYVLNGVHVAENFKKADEECKIMLGVSFNDYLAKDI